MFFSSFLLACIVTCFHHFSSTEIPPLSTLESLRNIPGTEKPVSSCNACSTLVNSFLKGLEETTRQNFEGGDAAWERQNLGSYENSELRFIEIQEKLCADVSPGKDQCYNLAEINEHELENWYYEKRNDDLFSFLCITKLKVCCPENTYGPNCIPCPGGVEEPCSGHGKCKNGGTREKHASCDCNSGYTGNLCNECKNGYYPQETSTLFICKECDEACKNHCRGPGPKNCEVCSDAYYFHENEGCITKDDELISLQESQDLLNETGIIETSLENQFDNVSSTITQGHSEL